MMKMVRPRKKKCCVSGSLTDCKILALNRNFFLDYVQGVPFVAKTRYQLQFITAD